MTELPFKIYDGKTTRSCTYKDLFVMLEFGLPFVVWKKSKWFFFRKKESPNLVKLIYVSLKTMKQLSNFLPYGNGTITIGKLSNISKVECPSLHRYLKSSLVQLMAELE